jgi:hypothetical protein
LSNSKHRLHSQKDSDSVHDEVAGLEVANHHVDPVAGAAGTGSLAGACGASAAQAPDARHATSSAPRVKLAF